MSFSRHIFALKNINNFRLITWKQEAKTEKSPGSWPAVVHATWIHMVQSNTVILKRWKRLNLPQACRSIVLFSFIFHINSGLLQSKLTMNNSSNAGDNPNVPPPKKTWKLSIDDKSSAITFPSEIFQFSWLVFDSPPKTNRFLVVFFRLLPPHPGHSQ